MRSDEKRLVEHARSCLFVPGDRPDRFAKAAAAGADLVIIDLEDAVAAEEKPTARREVRRWLSEGGRAAVRLSAPDTDEHGLDLEALGGLPGLVAVAVAKVEEGSSLDGVARRLDVPVVPLIETARGMRQVEEITSTAGVARLAFGHIDYSLDLGCVPEREALLHARSTLVMISRSAGLPGPIDGVTTTLDVEDQLRADLRHSRRLGFTGKLLIHPAQVAETHRAFQPTDVEITWAGKVLAAVKSSGDGAIRVDGALVDAPVAALAQQILRRAEGRS